MSELEHWAERIAQAKMPEELLGTDPTVAAVNEHYRRLSLVVHPDRHGGSALAMQAFRALTVLRDRALSRIESKVYGSRDPDPAPKPSFVPVSLKSRRATYAVLGKHAAGDYCDLWLAEMFGTRYVIKVLRSPQDKGLVENERSVLKALYPDGTANSGYRRYLEPIVDTFSVTVASGSRPANVFRCLDGWHSLADVARAYPQGLDYRDAAWMLKRVLEVLGFAHREGFVHGAVIPEHVLIHPNNHGAKLIDWGYAVQKGKPLRSVVSSRKAFWGVDELKKTPASPATDIYAWAELGLWLTKLEVPAKRFLSFLQGCKGPQRRRPTDAWALHEELSQLLRELVGPPAFRPFTMPGM